MRRSRVHRAAHAALACLLPFVAQVARAQSPAPPPPPAAPDPSEARVADAHADRMILAPTAYTHPEGSVTLSSYDIVGVQAGYAVSDSSQITLTGVPPLSKEQIVPLDLSLKTVVARGDRARAAFIGSATGIAGTEMGSVFVGRFGGVAQLCFDDACDGSASFGSTLLLAGPVLLTLNGAGVIVPINRWFALLGEIDTLMPLGRAFGDYNGLAGGAGVRFRKRGWAIDLAALRPVDAGELKLLPVLAITWRILP